MAVHCYLRCPPPSAEVQLRWYIKRIKAALPSDTTDGWAGHPKVAETVSRVLDPWRRGEKVLFFCFYRETGRAVRNHISRAIQREVVEQAARALECPADETVQDEVETIPPSACGAATSVGMTSSGNGSPGTSMGSMTGRHNGSRTSRSASCVRPRS